MTKDDSPDALQDAARGLYDAHGAALYRFCHRLTLSGDEAGDLVAEAFLDAMRAKTSVALMENPRAWLYRVAARRWTKRRRSLRRFVPLAFAESRAAPAASDFTDLERALARLPDRLRIVFVMVRAEGLTYAEAALALSVPEGTLKSRVHEATALLRRDLADALPHDPLCETP